MSLADARADLVTTLEDTGYKVYGYDAPKVIPGAMVLEESEPFLEYGDVQSRPDIMSVNFDVVLFQDYRNPAIATKAMDAMVEAAVLNLGDWTLTNLRSHYRLRLQENGPVFLVSRLSVTKYTSIGSEI